MIKEWNIDRAAIERLNRLGGKKLVREMIRSFIENTPKKISDAFEAEKKGNLKAIEIAAHDIKSSAGNLGVIFLQKIAFDIEEQAVSGNFEVIISRLIKLNEVFEEAMEYFLKEREKW